MGYALIQGRLKREDEQKFFELMGKKGLTVSEMTRELISKGLKAVEAEAG